MIGRIAAIAGAVFADAVRRRVVYVILLFAGVLVMAIPSLPNYGLGIAPALYREVALALTYVAALALALALAAVRVPGEVERRTVYCVLTRPVARWEYLAGTWLGVFAVVGAAIGGFTIVENVVGLARYGSWMPILWEGALGIWLEMGVVTALAVAVSSMIGPVVVVVASTGLLFAGHLRDVLFAQKSGIWYALYPSLDTFAIINPVAHGSGVGVPYVLGMLLAFAAWVAAFLVIGSLGFGRRDL